MKRALALTAAILAAPLACSPPELGELPATCPDGACPAGFSCIHDVCARPSDAIPIPVAETPFLRGVDFRVLSQASSALLAWQTYAYSPEGEGFDAVRLAADGHVSAPVRFATDFAADPDTAEPSYDLLRLAEDELLLAVAAGPLPDDASAEPRLVPYRVKLPPPDSAAAAVFEHFWSDAARLSTIGYGAVSRPRLVAGSKGIELGYFRTMAIDPDTMMPATLGELAVFPLDPSFAAPIAPPAPAHHRARQSLPVAVGVEQAFAVEGGVWWVLDDTRPSALFIAGDGSTTAEGPLDRLGIGLTASATSLTYLRPSARAGQKLPTDPVSGPAEIHRLTTMGSATTDGALATIVPVRDTPPPAWIERPGKPGLLITPGADIGAAQFGIFSVDPQSGKTTTASFIRRNSTLPLAAVGAALAGGKLFVAWAEQGADRVILRAAIVAEP